MIDFFFLHHHSQVRADMLGYLLFFCQVGSRCALTLRTRMQDLWFTGLSAGHVKRVPVRGMQGPLEKQKT